MPLTPLQTDKIEIEAKRVRTNLRALFYCLPKDSPWRLFLGGAALQRCGNGFVFEYGLAAEVP
jgi:hypothetical protein